MLISEFINFDKKYFEEAAKNISASWNEVSKNDTVKSTLQKLEELIEQYKMNEISVPVFNMTNDLLFVNDTIRATKTQADRNEKSVWIYSFEYKSTKRESNLFDLAVSGNGF